MHLAKKQSQQIEDRKVSYTTFENHTFMLYLYRGNHMMYLFFLKLNEERLKIEKQTNNNIINTGQGYASRLIQKAKN